MPALWVSAGIGAVGLLNSMGQSGSSGGGSNYTPTDLSGADTGWQNSFNQEQNIAGQNYNTAAPMYSQALQQQNAINYSPYQQNANTVGQQYANLANTANQQVGQYQNQANIANQQQASLYQGANQIMNQAFDPNMAQYNQSFNNLSGQVNAGQAMRGLGNSAVGAQEANNAASNFGIGWNTQQLQNEQIGLQGAASASNAGGSQGQLASANMAGALSAGASGAGYQTQAGAVPLAAQQMIAGMPATNASAYEGNMNNLATGYSNAASSAIPYMNAGIGAQQANTAYNTQQNAANTQLLTQALGGTTGANANNPNSPSSWLNNVFGSSNSATPSATTTSDLASSINQTNSLFGTSGTSNQFSVANPYGGTVGGSSY